MMSDRQRIDVDSTAVLSFDDGVRIPCDRYIMRTFCSVIRALLESEVVPDLDARGRTVLPLPQQPSAPYWTALDVLHACRATWSLSVGETVRTLECMEYLGCGVHHPALESRLWMLVSEWTLEHRYKEQQAAQEQSGGCVVVSPKCLMDFVPRLLRNAVLAGAMVRRLLVLRPQWCDFVRDVLTPLEPSMDRIVAYALVAYAPHFFPPALVVCWVLRACPNLTTDLALTLASQHGMMYHPSEVAAVLRSVADTSTSDKTADLLRMALASLTTYQPLPSCAVDGSVIKFHDVDTASVCVRFVRGNRQSCVRLTRWLKMYFWPDGRFDVRFDARKIDPDVTGTGESRKLQLRIMCFDHNDAPRGECAEAWYAFEDVGGGGGGVETTYHTLAHSSRGSGRPSAISSMLRAGTARQMRLDFFYGADNVLDVPFDLVTVSSRIVANIL